MSKRTKKDIVKMNSNRLIIEVKISGNVVLISSSYFGQSSFWTFFVFYFCFVLFCFVVVVVFSFFHSNFSFSIGFSV